MRAEHADGRDGVVSARSSPRHDMRVASRVPFASAAPNDLHLLSVARSTLAHDAQKPAALRTPMNPAKPQSSLIRDADVTRRAFRMIGVPRFDAVAL